MRKLLDYKLLSQPFTPRPDSDLSIEQAKSAAQMYTTLENKISVLSDMKARKSYIYHSPLAAELGLELRSQEIDSIWEDELLERIHPQDLQKKYRLEFQYFQLLKTIDPALRKDHSVITRLRVKDCSGNFVIIRHRLIYIASSADGHCRLALCLYDKTYDYPGLEAPSGMILNNRLGEIIEDDWQPATGLLSPREKEVLQLIRLGKRSKEIAAQLFLSINTVNRHRQNIFQKLNVSNAIEACRIMEYLA